MSTTAWLWLAYWASAIVVLIGLGRQHCNAGTTWLDAFQEHGSIPAAAFFVLCPVVNSLLAFGMWIYPRSFDLENE